MPAATKKDVEDLKEWLSERFDTQDTKLTIIEHNLAIHNDRITTLEDKTSILTKHEAVIKQLQAKSDEQEQQLAQMEARILQENFRFNDIETHGSPEESIKHFLINSLKIPADTVKQMEFIKCFRIGKPNQNGSDNSAYLVKFLRTNDKQTVLNSAFKKPRGVKGGVREDLPLKWAKSRSEQYMKFVLPARQSEDYINPKIKWLNGDNLEINGHKVSPSDTWSTIQTYLQKKQ